MMAKYMAHMLTTYDNPYDPFTEFDGWLAYDASRGYHTPSLLARVVITSDDLSDADQALAVEYAIDEIIRENISGMHRKVSKEYDPEADNTTPIEEEE